MDGTQLTCINKLLITHRGCDTSCACKLDIYFVSVKYVFVCIKLVCIFGKLLKI
jgi:hypothetical protein